MIRLFCVFLLCISYAQLYAQDAGQFFKLTETKFSIYGTTNVNKFKCELKKSGLNDTLYITGSWQGNKVNLEGMDLRLDVNSFDCGMNLMTKDFQEIMMSDTYPEIRLQINQLIFSSNPLEEFSYDLSSVAFLSIAEKMLTENIESGYLIQKDKKQIIGGTHHVKMTSFGLTPPTKFLGTIKVKDELSLEFELLIEQI